MIELRQLSQNGELHLYLQGEWVFAQIAAIKAALQQVQPVVGTPLVVDAQAVARLDVTAAWVVYQQAQSWIRQGYEVHFDHFPAEYLRYFAATEASDSSPSPDKGRLGGVSLSNLWQVLRSFITFFGHSIAALFTSLFSPHLFRFRAVFHHVFTTGISAVPIVALIACLISIVITYQGGGQLRDLGAEIYTVDMVTISVLRELGVLLTAIMVAGRSGSAFAAEIGLMKTNQEVDALLVMGKDPFLILVVPRLVALVIALPLLTVLADIVALMAAALIASTILDISFVQFFTHVQTNIEFRTFAAGLIKAPFFAVVIALIGCWQGMRVSGSSASLGEHTTKAVVDSIFLVLLLDALFSILFYRLGF
ncbi:MAG: ABC transporter permease [Candidatus Thiothrix putei]|uniref:Phospholipid/cholesterol/gamma-HCH transport system permease protein n=2 Tax=Thiothrix TaxID=1030 RepID=A0A1H4GHR4_9GAMM|nr:ABC transporter permease [Thiothrix caldifontis]WGZ95491.1 MAG: ABC transporter permease [Candidatus Thiothrix putei]SEB09165.1 phospholipid/cholesterol/gamma-HCH transport system permease protein [Thiothrix caldifontis]